MAANAAVRTLTEDLYEAAVGVADTIEGMKTARAYAPDHPVYENGFTDDQRKQVRNEAQDVAAAWEDAYTAVHDHAADLFDADKPVQALVYETESFRTGFDDGHPENVHPRAAEMELPAYTINWYVDTEHILLGSGRRTGRVREMADAFDVELDQFLSAESLAERVAAHTSTLTYASGRPG